MNTRKELAKIPTINYGGCGIASLIMYRELKQNNRATKNTGFVYLFYAYHLHEKRLLEETIRGQNNKYIVPSHIVLRHRGRYYDTDKICKNLPENYPGLVDTLFIKDEGVLVKTINDKYEWNEIFNRKSVKKFKNYLKDIKL